MPKSAIYLLTPGLTALPTPEWILPAEGLIYILADPLAEDSRCTSTLELINFQNSN